MIICDWIRAAYERSKNRMWSLRINNGRKEKFLYIHTRSKAGSSQIFSLNFGRSLFLIVESSREYLRSKLLPSQNSVSVIICTIFGKRTIAKVGFVFSVLENLWILNFVKFRWVSGSGHQLQSENFLRFFKNGFRIRLQHGQESPDTNFHRNWTNFRRAPS